MDKIIEIERSGIFAGPVKPEWLLSGAWLYDAWEKFGGTGVSLAKDEAQKFSNLHGESLDIYVFNTSKDFQKSENCDFETVQVRLWPAPPQQRGAISFLNWGKELPEPVQNAWRLYGQFRCITETGITSKLICGDLRAYGSRGRTAAPPEWIPTMSWQHLKRDESRKNKVSDGSETYFHVHVVDPYREPEIIHPVAGKTGTSSKVPFDTKNAQITLTAEKMTGRYLKRPTEEQLANLLATKFITTPRDPIREIAANVWPREKTGETRGRKKGRPTGSPPNI